MREVERQVDAVLTAQLDSRLFQRHLEDKIYEHVMPEIRAVRKLVEDPSTTSVEQIEK